jgi:molybdate transport system substrate-binding protein
MIAMRMGIAALALFACAALYTRIYYPPSLQRTKSRYVSRSGIALVSILFPILAGAMPIAAVAASVTVFAAASLREALDYQSRQFQTSTGNKVVVSYAASNALAKQIEAGAPADVFISADLDWMDYLEQRRLVAPNTRVTLLRNTLVLIAPAASSVSLKIGPRFGLAAALGSARLAIANPDSVPAGKYGKSALEALDVWTSVETKLARTENVRAALALVARGEAPLGIVYRTDALAEKGIRIVDTFPAPSHPPIRYPAAIVATSQSAAARPLLDYLRSPSASRTWEKYGYGVAK